MGSVPADRCSATASSRLRDLRGEVLHAGAGDVFVPGKIDQIALVDNPWFGADDRNAVQPERKQILGVIDYKTTGSEMGAFIEGLLMSHQGDIYLKWIQSDEFANEFPEIIAEHGKPVAVVFDVIRIPAIRVKKNESVAEFNARLTADRTSDPDKHYCRQIHAPSDRALLDTVRSFNQSAKVFSMYVADGHFPKCDACSQVNFHANCPQAAVLREHDGGPV